MGEGTGYLGGFLIPDPLSGRIIEDARMKLRVSQAGALTVEMDAPTLKMAKITKEPTASWVPEHKPAAFSDLNYDLIEMQAKKVVAMSKLSEELVNDAANLEQILLDSMGWAIAKAIDRVALLGSGTGEPLGLYSTDGVGMTEQASVDVDIDVFLDAIYTLVGLNIEQARLSSIHNADVAKKISKIKASTSGVYLEPNAPEAWTKLRKLLTSQVPTETATSNIYLGDYGDLYIGVLQQLGLEVSRSAADNAGNSAFTQSEVWFRMITRVDTLVVRPASFHIIRDAGV